MSDPAYDNFDHGSLSTSVSSPAVSEAQQLLQLLGYDPGEMSGFWGQQTQNAVQALWMALGEKGTAPTSATPELLQKLRQLVARGLPHMQLPADPMRAPAQSLVDRTATKRPAWLSPGFIAAGLGAAVLGYFWWKEQQSGEGAAPSTGDGELLAGAPAALKKAKGAKKTETCARTPVLPFESGAALAPPDDASSAPSAPSTPASMTTIDVSPSTTAPSVLP